MYRGEDYQMQETETIATGASTRVGQCLPMSTVGRNASCRGGSRAQETQLPWHVNEYDSQAIQRWLMPLVQRHGISTIFTNDLFNYRVVTDKLQLGHRTANSIFGVGLDEAYMI